MALQAKDLSLEAYKKVRKAVAQVIDSNPGPVEFWQAEKLIDSGLVDLEKAMELSTAF